jgi:hypothetical protein
MKNSTKVVLGVAVCIAIGVVSSHFRNAEPPAYSRADLAANAAEAQRDAAAAANAASEAKARAAPALRYYQAAKGALALQAGMRDPDSFQLVTVADMQNGALCYEYRERNGFGGMDAGRAAMAKNTVATDPASWKKNCGGKPGTDITAKVQGSMELARTGKVSLF